MFPLSQVEFQEPLNIQPLPAYPERKLEQLEKDSNDLDVPEESRAAYKRMVRKELSDIRRVISLMRAEGCKENAINSAVDRLSRDFNESRNRFIERTNQFHIDQANATRRNQETAEKIKKTNLDFTPIKRVASNSPCQRPSFSKADEAFSKVESIYQLTEVAGGKLKQNFEGKVFINGCASRISYVMGQTGCKIPVIPGETVSGKDGEQYIYRLSALGKFMSKAYGPPDCEWKKGKPNPEKCESLTGRAGILIMRWGPGPYTTCTGHAKLIDGKQWSDFPPVDGAFWELPEDEQN